MAYKDENGKITIDDVAAGEDIRKIERAQSILQNALQSLRAAQTEGANSKGETAQAIYDKSQELINQIQRLDSNLEETTNYIRHVLAVYKAKDENISYEKELKTKIAKLENTRQKYIDLYTDDIITRAEMNEKIGGSKKELERLQNELKMVSYHLTKGEQLEVILNNTFKEISDITDVRNMTNAQLKKIIQKIEVDKDGNVDIYLRLFGELGLDQSVLIYDSRT